MAAQSARIRKLLSAWAALSFRRPWVVVLACLAFGTACALLAAGLGFRGDLIELLPEKAEEVRDMRFVEARAGGGGYMVVQVTGGDQERRRAFAAKWAEAMEKETEIARYVEWRFEISFFRTRALLLLSAEKLARLHDDLAARIQWERTRANPLFVDLMDEKPPPTMKEIEETYASDAPKSEYVESKDGSELYLYVKPVGVVTDLDFSRRMIATADRISKEVGQAFPGIHTRYTGQYVQRVEEDDLMKRDLATASGLSGLIALGVILLATRRLTSMVMVTVPVSVGIVFTFAVARLTVGHLNPITGFLAAILIGLGIEYGVHLVMRFREERKALDVLPALETTVLGTFNGALTSASTNAAAFFVLVFAQFLAFKQFGFLAAVGVMATVASTYAMGPAVLVLSERLGWGKKAPPEPLPEIPALPGKHRVPSGAIWALLVAVLAWAVWSVTVARHVGFETNLLALRGESKSTELETHINQQLGIIMTPALVHVENLEQARAVTRIAEEVHRASGAASPIDKIASLNDLVPEDLERRQAGIDKLKKLFDDLPDSFKKGELAEKTQVFRDMFAAKPWGPGEIPLEIRRRFTALSGGGTFALIFPKKVGHDTRTLDIWADHINTIVERCKAAGVPARVLDNDRIASRILRLVKADGPFVMAAAAVVVFLMIWFSLRRLGDALLVAGPLYLGITCLIGLMRLIDLKLNFFNIVVLPNLLSIAVDNSVHLFHRYHEEGPGSLAHVVRTTGLAAFVATLSNAAGYGALLVAHHQGLRSLAVMAIAGVACTFVGTTLLFPGLLALLERRRQARNPSASNPAAAP